MKNYVEQRVIEVANYIVDTQQTMRATAKKFGVSKSTIAKDVDYRLKELDLKLYENVRKILNYHLQVRAIRGGEALKKIKGW